ncbi:MAG: hypothetical protein FJW30_30205 [Acidobacteria bacterium]|nr:hypothetical protein [Acidobacteriota bacterium]
MRFRLLLAAPVLFSATDPAQWPRWRGPDETGVAKGTAPVQWSEKDIAWKAAISGRGHSSPVIWGDTIFLTTAIPTQDAGPPSTRRGEMTLVEHKFAVLAINRKDGKVIWEKTVKTATPHEGYHFRYGSFASNSPVTDGKLVFAHFGSRGLYALDFKGNVVWSKQFGQMRMRNSFGEGVPAVVHEDRLLMGFDQEEGSYLITLDKNTGKEIWKVERQEVSSWSPPTVITVGGRKQIIVAATAYVTAYDYLTGKVIWKCNGLGTNVIPAPIHYKDTVIVMSGHREPNRMAIKLGRDGDLSGTDAVVWSNTKSNSYTPSPVLHGDRLYFVTDKGLLSAIHAGTGELLYTERLPGANTLKASPVGANGNLYLPTEEGMVHVVKMSDRFELVASNKVGDEFFIATPAIFDGEIYLRGKNTLYCIRQAK